MLVNPLRACYTALTMLFVHALLVVLFFLIQSVHPAAPPPQHWPDRISIPKSDPIFHKLVNDGLGSDSFEEREKAQAILLARAAKALEALDRGSRHSDLEIRIRSRRILDKYCSDVTSENVFNL